MLKLYDFFKKISVVFLLLKDLVLGIIIAQFSFWARMRIHLTQLKPDPNLN